MRARWAQAAAGWLIVIHETADGEIKLITPRDGQLADAGYLRVDHRGSEPVLTVDLLHVRRISRMLLVTTANNQSPPQSGALVFGTYGKSEIDLPIALPVAPANAVVATVYNVAGELVVRAERDAVNSTLQDVCDAYGYDRLTWLDPYTPLR